MSVQKGSNSPSLQVKLENEKDIFRADYKLPGSPDTLPYRKIWDVAFYNNKAELVSLHEIAKSGPFVGVASAEKSEGVKEQFKNMNYKISLHPVIEYSLELPYGRQARIWVTTETACYRIMSVSANYTSYWQPFYEMVCFAGHVVNILLNYRGPVMMVKLITRISRLSGKNGEETYTLLRNHRKFIHDLLKDQNLSARIRKEYNALQSNQATWEIDWEEHVKASEKKPEKKEKPNILSFFRSRSKDENAYNSVNSSNSSFDAAAETDSSKNNFDETSSILSISEEESATYIEFPNEVVFEDEEQGLQSHLASSFTSARFLEWSLQESESLTNSHYNCPLCKITFKSDGKDCISAFCVHLKAHCADFEEEPKRFEDDFEERFRRFRSDLQKCMTGKLSYAPMPLVFEKKLGNFCPEISSTTFQQYPVLESDEPAEPAPLPVNPIKTIKFVTTTTASVVAPSKPTSPVAATASNPAPKKPRVRKPAAPKVSPQPAAETIPAAPMTTDTSTTPQVTAPVPVKTVILTPPKPVSPPAIPASSANAQSLTVSAPMNTAQTNPTPSPLTLQRSANANSVSVNNLVNLVSVPQLMTSAPVSNPVTTVPPPANTNPVPVPVSNRPPPPIQQQPPKSIINLEADGPSNSSLPIRAKRPLSAVPVPIELLPSEDSVTPPVPSLNDLALTYSADSKNLGCSHYKLNCKFYAECCGKWFPCRFCHDAASDHKLNRHKTRFCVCLFCGTSQRAGSRCINEKCKALMAHYYCDKCKFWDNDANKLIYHCDKCGICRAGLQANYTHCDKCRKCVSKAAFVGHQCEPRSPVKSTESFPPSPSPANLNPVLNVPRPDLPALDPIDKKPRLDLPLETSTVNPAAKTPQNAVNVEAPKPPSVDQTNYVKYLKNSLTNWRNKAPSASTITVSDNKQKRNCWNCLNSLPNTADGSIQNKYCVHCSAIIE